MEKRSKVEVQRVTLRKEIANLKTNPVTKIEFNLTQLNHFEAEKDSYQLDTGKDNQAQPKQVFKN